MKRASRYARFARQEEADEDPISAVANLFDVGMVFACSLMVAMVTYLNLGEMLSDESVTVVKNPGQSNMEIIRKDGRKIERYTAAESSGGSPEGRGRRVGTAYQLENGEIIYIPE
jgi:hypothetical protein